MNGRGMDMRFRNVVRNSFFSVLSQIILIFLGFCSSRVLNHQMGEALVGVNGVISNVLGILSVTELGFSTAVVFHLYRVLDEKDEEKTAALMNLYRRAYQIIAAVIGMLGMGFLPFIHQFMRENPFSVTYIRTIYFLWLLRTVITYLMSYRRSVLIADQREYAVSIVVLLTNLLNYSAIIFIVTYTRNYILALGLNVFFEAVMNFILNRYVDRRYAYLKKYRKIRIDKESKKHVFDDMKNIFFSKLSIKILTSTDNLVISGLIGVVVNGLYNNYCMISSSVVNLIMAVSNSLQPTVGNLFLEKDRKKNYDVFRQISFLFFLITSFSFSSLLALMTPFVGGFWLGESYVLDEFTVFFIAVSAAVTILGSPLNIVMSVSGLFQIERNLSIAAAMINIISSIILAGFLGVSGVIIGTILSNTICILVRAKVFFQKFLKLSIQTYVWEMISYLFLTGVEAFLTVLAVNRTGTGNGIGGFLLDCVICLIIPNGINLLLFSRSWRLRSVLWMVRHLGSGKDAPQ